MAYILREGLAFCFVDKRPVFLDIGRNRYFLLRSSHEDAFLGLVDGRLPVDAGLRAEIEELLGLTAPVTAIGRHLIQSDAMMRPLSPFDPGRASILQTAMATVSQSRFGRRLRRQPLDKIIRSLVLSCGADCTIGRRERGIIAAHRMAALARTTRGRCLETSLALASALAKVGCHPKIMFGVALAPFRAHCWLQHGDMVLNDHPDFVRPFTPILVL